MPKVLVERETEQDTMLARASGKVVATTSIRRATTVAKAATSESPVKRAGLAKLPRTLSAAVEVSLESLEKDTMGETWYNALSEEFSKPYFRKLKDFIIAENKEHTVYPSAQDIYTWSRLTPLDEVKVVILGQDPYHNVGQAHGLAFSVLPPTKPPGSLKNIYKQISLDYPAFVQPNSGDLSPLAKSGVLFLNAVLTVRAHQAASHSKKGWETFTAEVLRKVTARTGANGVVFMLWGLPAQKTCAALKIDEKKNLVLKSAHPSPLSAHRGFLGNGHFRKANEWLRKRYGEDAVIDWTVLSKAATKR